MKGGLMKNAPNLDISFVFRQAFEPYAVCEACPKRAQLVASQVAFRGGDPVPLDTPIYWCKGRHCIRAIKKRVASEANIGSPTKS